METLPNILFKFLFSRGFFWKAVVVFFFCSHSLSNCYLYFEGTTWFLFICFCFCFQKQLGDSVLISSKKRAANVSYLSFCKRKNMPLISVWQFENCPHWMLEWVRGRSPEQILNFPVWLPECGVTRWGRWRRGWEPVQEDNETAVDLWACWIQMPRGLSALVSCPTHPWLYAQSSFSSVCLCWWHHHLPVS